MLLGGRAAEELVLGKISTGAANDLTRATDVARRMITDYGMSERFRHVALTRRAVGIMGPQAEQFMNREYSEDTQKYVDDEIARIVAARYDGVLALLAGKRELLDRVAATLLEKETIEEAEFAAFVAGPLHEAGLDAASLRAVEIGADAEMDMRTEARIGAETATDAEKDPGD
jgi:cell division protease FtsH